MVLRIGPPFLLIRTTLAASALSIQCGVLWVGLRDKRKEEAVKEVRDGGRWGVLDRAIGVGRKEGGRGEG